LRTIIVAPTQVEGSASHTPPLIAGYEPWSMDFADFFDLNMLVTVGGRERSMPEWETLLDKAGMQVEKVEYADGLWQAGAPAVLQVKLK
jgi:hypothetical protein